MRLFETWKIESHLMRLSTPESAVVRTERTSIIDTRSWFHLQRRRDQRREHLGLTLTHKCYLRIQLLVRIVYK